MLPEHQMLDRPDDVRTISPPPSRSRAAAETNGQDRAAVAAFPRVWVLKCHRAGDHAQSLGLAHALGWPFVVKQTKFHWYELFFALPGYITLVGLHRRKSSPIEEGPWPDLIIMAGRQNETPAKWIRRQSGGRTKIVVIGRYWTPPDELDLVVTTHQFRLPPHPNVLHNDYPLHLATQERFAKAADHWRPRLEGLSRPFVAVLVGGSTGPYIFSPETARRLGREASAFARARGATLLVSTSARTGRRAQDALEKAIDVPCHFYRWQPGDAENPYLGFLALADEFIVTADSMSMLAEACTTDRPVHVFEFGGGPAAMHGPRSADNRVRQWWRWSQLKDQGLLGLPYAFAIGLPARRLNRSRDIRRVQDIFISSGRARWLGDPDTKPRHALPVDDLDRAIRRVHKMLGLDMSPQDKLLMPNLPAKPSSATQGYAETEQPEAGRLPLVWLILSNKTGDNAQLHALADALPWPCQIKRVTVRAPFVLGKPKVSASLHHVDPEHSDGLEPPWPDLVITIGRRMSMVALWIREQSEGRTKIALLGLPKRFVDRFDLAIASEQYRQPNRANLMRIKYPLQRIDEVAIDLEAGLWRDKFAHLPRPLTAVMVGGLTNAVRFDAATAVKLAKDLGDLVRRQGGSLVVTTSRRTPADVVAVLERDLPPGSVLYRWTPDDAPNPYRALLGLADRFVVTSDSISMLTEIARLGRPLAIYRLPVSSWLGDGALGALAKRLLPGGLIHGLGQVLGGIMDRIGAGHHRDLTALHRLLVKDGFAVWFGEPFGPGGRRPVDEMPQVVARILALVERP
ncbi:MAG: ELM1/GtrOC1 family putative glycosyltransferase [Dongiaceae bacterium]